MRPERTEPRGAGCRQNLFDAHCPHLVHEVLAKDAIAIPQQVPWCRLPPEGFAHLLGRPLCRWMCSNREMQNAPPLVRQHQRTSFGTAGRPGLPCRIFQR